MNEEELMQVLLAPRISEKSTRLGDQSGQYVFDVWSKAGKLDIKKAVETMFGVKVASVQTCNIKGKVRRFRGILGRRAGHKKAYVRLKQGHEINFTGGQ
ncbi:MAG: 50S ribosomal protein L23 [Gammaproteobacteria bacterium]